MGLRSCENARVGGRFRYLGYEGAWSCCGNPSRDSIRPSPRSLSFVEKFRMMMTVKSESFLRENPNSGRGKFRMSFPLPLFWETPYFLL